MITTPWGREGSSSRRQKGCWLEQSCGRNPRIRCLVKFVCLRAEPRSWLRFMGWFRRGVEWVEGSAGARRGPSQPHGFFFERCLFTNSEANAQIRCPDPRVSKPGPAPSEQKAGGQGVAGGRPLPNQDNENPWASIEGVRVRDWE